MTKEIKVPDASHPISIDSGTVRVVARVGDTVIADTGAALTLREAVPGTLRPSTSETYCPCKGDAPNYDIVLPGGKELADAVWTYQAPYPAAADRVRGDHGRGAPPGDDAGDGAGSRNGPKGCPQLPPHQRFVSYPDSDVRSEPLAG